LNSTSIQGEVMETYEKNINESIDQKKELPKKLDYSILAYFWQANPILSSSREVTLPRFLRNVDVLKNFSDNELRILSKFLHLRVFQPNEVVFDQGDRGVGFYFIYSGYIDIMVKKKDESQDSLPNDKKKEIKQLIVSLEKGSYFGELALLKENSVRNATAISRDVSELVGIFKPDIEELIHSYPIIAAKLLQSVSVIIAKRLSVVTAEVQSLKFKLSKLSQMSKHDV